MKRVLSLVVAILSIASFTLSVSSESLSSIGYDSSVHVNEVEKSTNPNAEIARRQCSQYVFSTSNKLTSVCLTTYTDSDLTLSGIFYKLDGYGICQNKLVLDTRAYSNIEYCGIDLETSILTVVHIDSLDTVSVYDVYLGEIESSNETIKIVNDSITIRYETLSLDEAEDDEDLDVFLKIGGTVTWIEKYGSENQSMTLTSNAEIRQ